MNQILGEPRARAQVAEHDREEEHGDEGLREVTNEPEAVRSTQACACDRWPARRACPVQTNGQRACISRGFETLCRGSFRNHEHVGSRF